MADQPVRFTPLGNLDKDSEYKLVGKGNYTDALDIIKQDDEGQVSGTIQPTKRNKHAFSLGSVQAQNKKYRVTVDGDATKSHAIKFLSTKRDLRITTGTGSDGSVEFNGTIADLQSQFNLSNLPGAFQVTVSGNTMEFELVAYNYYQWYLESVGEDDVSVVCIQEAIPTDLAGPLKDIGSYDLLGDLFVFSTTQDNEPTELEAEIIGVGPIAPNPIPPPAFVFGGPLTSLTFNAPHGLQEGQWIRITDSTAPWLNGTFVVNSVTSPTGIEIVTDTAWGASHEPHIIGQEKTFIHQTGIGEIGVAQKNNTTESWTYTRLLRSWELNFISKKHQRGLDGRIKGKRKIIYYTDKYNTPRKFEYIGGYIEDGAIEIINNLNQYIYDNISIQSNIFNNTIGSLDTKITYVGQSDSGGFLLGGNKYYTFRFKDAENAYTNWADPTKAVPVINRALTDDAILLKGSSVDDSETTKIVNLRLEGIPQGLYDKVEFAVIESDAAGGLTGTIFRDDTLSSETQSLNFSHQGDEEDQIPMDTGELALSINSFSSINKAGDLSIIDKRLVMGNISYTSVSDIESWAKTFTHELAYKNISGIGDITDEKLGGYLDPNNVFNYPSLTLYETYRFGVDVTYKDGSISPTFWIDDIRVDTLGSNQANITDNRRVANGGLPNYALNESVGNYKIKVPYVRFSNIDIDFTIDGVPLRNAISSIRFRVAEVETALRKREVLASGFVIPGIEGSQSISPIIIDQSAIGIEKSYPAGYHGQYLDWLGTYKLATQQSTPSSPLSGSVEYDGVEVEYPNGFNSHRRTSFFYSPDISMGRLDDYEYKSGDKLNVFYPIRKSFYRTTSDNYNQLRLDQNGSLRDGGIQGVPTGNKMLPSQVAEYIAFPPRVSQPLALANSNGVNQYNIDDSSIINPGESIILDGVDINLFHKEKSLNSGLGEFIYPEFEISHDKCIAIRTENEIFPYSHSYWESENVDFGIYYAQLFRDGGVDKYGDKDTTKYRPYSQSFPASDIKNISVKFDVFLGESFTTKNLIRQRFAKEDQPDNPLAGGPSSLNSVLNVGSHVGMTYFAQTNMNTELVSVNPDGQVSFPETFTGSMGERLRRWTDIPTQDGFGAGRYGQVYNSRYSYGLETLLREAYNEENNELLSDVPSRIIYSSRDLYSSISDSMTLFLPINRHDLDSTFGEIISVDNINGELFTLQPRKYQSQYFNSRGQLQGTSQSVEVLIGDGSVLSRDGQTLSTYGTNHIWSIIKGSSAGGKDVIYWFNQENGLFMRFGADGTVVLSERSGIRSFAANNTRWTENQHTPAFNYGIRSVWDDRFKEAIWTFIGIRASKGAWGTLPSNQLYSEGATVTGVTFDNYSFDGIPDVYISLSNHFPIPQSEPGVGSDWETYWKLADKYDPEYYSVFTLAFNELSNGFSTFYSHLPKTYLKWKNKFLSSHPTERSEIYEHRYGYDKWYEYEGAWKESEPYLEGVVNPFPDQSKKFVAIQALTDNVPDRIELITKDHESFLVATDFDPEDDAWRTPIKNDILTSPTSDPNDDTVSLIGSYMRVKFKFFNGAYNKMNNLVVKVRQRLRRTQS
tara:strand:- start:5489 stop:10222 length:4734 start_codon:yes stop_codon:yes gene_type:complete